MHHSQNEELRVLQVAHTRGYGGLERQVLALATELRDAGHSVTGSSSRVRTSVRSTPTHARRNTPGAFAIM